MLLKSSSGACAKHVTGPETPALFTTISTLRFSFFNESNISVIAFSSLTSTPENILTNPPDFFSSIIEFNIFAAFSNGSFLLPRIITLAPFSTNFFATVIPIPVPLPVINATLFWNCNITKFLIVCDINWLPNRINLYLRVK